MANTTPEQTMLEHDAHTLAARLPDLLVEARRVATTVAFGTHGRRRAGTGETFWQFRQYQQTDSVTQIDWRRSASTDEYFVREREWEAAHTVWLWPDLSPSMNFVSHLSQTSKRDRAVVLFLAAAELLARGGERIGYIGALPPISSRFAMQRLANVIAERLGKQQSFESQPPDISMARYSEAILLSDFLEPFDETEARLRKIAAQGVQGHLVQIMDPAEETLPYSGRTEFRGMEGNVRFIAERAETLREQYIAKLEAHRSALQDLARSFNWSFLIHRTDQSAEQPLMALFARLSGQLEAAQGGLSDQVAAPSLGGRH